MAEEGEVEEIEEEEEEEGTPAPKDEGAGAGWLVSYADLMTLLFAAFVVLYGITPQGAVNEILGVMASIRESFVPIPDRIPEIHWDSQSYNSKRVFIKAKKDQVKPDVIKLFNRTTNQRPGKSLDFDELDILLSRSSKGPGVHKSLRSATIASKHEFGYTLALLDTAYFSRGSSDLKLRAQQLITTMARGLKGQKVKLLVEGHTETRPWSRTYDNMELSAKRAKAVANLIRQHSGLKGSEVRIAAYGATRPSASGTKEIQGRKINSDNRVVIKFMLQ